MCLCITTLAILLEKIKKMTRKICLHESLSDTSGLCKGSSIKLCKLYNDFRVGQPLATLCYIE